MALKTLLKNWLQKKNKGNEKSMYKSHQFNDLHKVYIQVPNWKLPCSLAC